MAAKHTPEPWEVSIAPFDAAVTVVRDGKRIDILGARTRGGSIGPEEEANITLAAAAPDLLEAAIGFVTNIKNGNGLTATDFQKIQAAIAKAKGEQP